MDRELSGRKQAAVQRHLTRCGACRKMLNDLQDLKPLLSSLDVSPAPANLTSRILTGAYEEKRRSQARPLRHSEDTSGDWAWVFRGATAAALLVGLTIGTCMGWNSFSAGRPGQSRMTAAVDISSDNLMYAYDAMSGAPLGSIEAAALNLLEDER